MTKFLLAALLGAFIFSAVAHAKENKIEPIRIVPKQSRTIASEDDGFIPLLTPKKPKVVKPLEKRKPATECAGSKCWKKKFKKSKIKS